MYTSTTILQKEGRLRRKFFLLPLFVPNTSYLCPRHSVLLAILITTKNIFNDTVRRTRTSLTNFFPISICSRSFERGTCVSKVSVKEFAQSKKAYKNPIVVVTPANLRGPPSHVLSTKHVSHETIWWNKYFRNIQIVLWSSTNIYKQKARGETTGSGVQRMNI